MFLSRMSTRFIRDGVHHVCKKSFLWKLVVQSEGLVIKNSKDGSDVVKSRLLHRKVLFIADGVDTMEQVEDVWKVVSWLAQGSRVIITTQDFSLFVDKGLGNVYQVKRLRYDEALQFFYQFAFKGQPPYNHFKQLLVRATKLAGCLPLSLKILGSFLNGKGEKDWDKTLQRLEAEQNEDRSDEPRSSVYELTLWGTVSIQGHRPEMEDAVAVSPHFLKLPIKMLMENHEGMSPSLTQLTAHFFGVYDGHGGHKVAEYCRDRLHFVLAEEIERIKDELCKRNTGETRQVQWEKVFTSCFVTIDVEIGVKMGRAVVGSSENVLEVVASESVGSTAVVALVCSSHIVVANCGDSREVLFRGKEAIPLSVEQHKPDREDEYARIEKVVGKFIQCQGAHVSGVLAISRSIGDRYLKPYVIREPEVTFMPRAREDDCLILASDGLWNVMDNQEACEMARRRILAWHKKHGAPPLTESGKSTDPACQAAADYLSMLALQKGSKDNISIIVIDLKAQRMFKTKT